MADTPRNSMNTPLPGDTFGGAPADPPSSSISHRSIERPADAGHVWGPSDHLSNGIPGGTRVVDDDNKPLSKSALEAIRKEAASPSTETVSTLGEPDPATATLDHTTFMSTAVASDADNTPGPRPYTPEEKAEAKARVNVPSTTVVTDTGTEQRPANVGTGQPGDPNAVVPNPNAVDPGAVADVLDSQSVSTTSTDAGTSTKAETTGAKAMTRGTKGDEPKS